MEIIMVNTNFTVESKYPTNLFTLCVCVAVEICLHIKNHVLYLLTVVYIQLLLFTVNTLIFVESYSLFVLY